MQSQEPRLTNGHTSPIEPVPEAARLALEHDIAESGGLLVEDPADAGSAGRTMFDTPASEDTTITVLVPRERIRDVPSQALLRIESREDGRTYLGVVVGGPFAEPDGLRGDAPVIVTAAVHGGLFLPRYHGRVQVEILGEWIAGVPRAAPPIGGGWGTGRVPQVESVPGAAPPIGGGAGANATRTGRVPQLEGGLVPPRYRPLPNSRAFPLAPEETRTVLKTGGDVRIGLAVGHENVPVGFASDRKDQLPRHTAILGTTGGGKSTTVAGLIARLQAAGVAVVLLDTEGEYTHLNEPTDDPTMLAALYRLGLRESGVADTHVFYPVGRETTNPDHPRVRPFRMRFSDLPADAVQEILDLNDAQRLRYNLAYDVARRLLRELHVFPRPDNAGDERELLHLDETETGFPGMTLGHLIDVAAALLTALKDKDAARGAPAGRPSTARSLMGNPAHEPPAPSFAPVSPLFQEPDNARRLVAAAKQARGETSHEISWLALLARLRALHRIGVFDTDRARSPEDIARTEGGKVQPLPVAEMLAPGRVTIVDLHDSDSPAVNNIVIAGLLRGLQQGQEAAYAEATRRGDPPTPVVVFIEEAHEFLSRERIARMPTLFQQVARIARRGRKRWLGLCFITQLPQHLPDEVFGLVNNLILHKIGDSAVVGRLKLTVPGIDASLWSRLPALAPGQAIVSVTGMTRPLLVAVDPTPAKLRMVD